MCCFFNLYCLFIHLTTNSLSIHTSMFWFLWRTSLALSRANMSPSNSASGTVLSPKYCENSYSMPLVSTIRTPQADSPYPTLFFRWALAMWQHASTYIRGQSDIFSLISNIGFPGCHTYFSVVSAGGVLSNGWAFRASWLRRKGIQKPINVPTAIRAPSRTRKSLFRFISRPLWALPTIPILPYSPPQSSHGGPAKSSEQAEKSASFGRNREQRIRRFAQI